MHRHRVAARPECGDVGALAVRGEVLAGGERVLNERVLLRDRGQTMPAAISTGATKSGRPGQHLVGGLVLLVDVAAAVTSKRPRLGACDNEGVGVPGRNGGQPVVDDLLLGDADLAQHGARSG